MEDFFDDGLDWEDWMVIGPLSEDMADEERKRKQIEEEIKADGVGPDDLE
jgi:hypothetical protein